MYAYLCRSDFVYLLLKCIIKDFKNNYHLTIFMFMLPKNLDVVNKISLRWQAHARSLVLLAGLLDHMLSLMLNVM